MHYSLSNSTKTNHLPSSSPSNMALNFSHDLLLQSSSHQGQSSSLNSSNSGSGSSSNNNNNNNSNNHHTTSSNHNNSSSNNSSSNNDNNGNSSNNSISNNIVAELKHNPLTGSLDLDPTNSHQLMQSAAAGMNMWKSTMAAASFLPTPSDMNTFSNWTHGNGLGGHHQAAPSMTHHILDGPNLITGYSQHNHHHHNHHQQRPTTIQQLQSQQVDLVGASLKSHASGLAVEQASFMLNSINQQVQSANSQSANTSSGSGHHHSGSHQDSTAQLHLSRSQQQQLDHNAATTTSYNLSMNDNQFYTTQSHVNTIKSSVFLHDRSGAGSHSNHLGQLSYHNAAAAVAAAEHLNPQPGTSGHPLAGTSSSSGGGSSSSKNIGNFRCPHCSEMFNMRNLYQSHLKTHSQDKGSKAKFHCELCGHSFSQKTSLNRHMKSHTGERPFPCEVCGKAFSEKERLKIHMRTHTGEKPFSCGICGKSFSQKSTVKRHQTVHTGEKKFKCDCGKGFANRGNLIAHIKTRGSNHFE